MFFDPQNVGDPRVMPLHTGFFVASLLGKIKTQTTTEPESPFDTGKAPKSKSDNSDNSAAEFEAMAAPTKHTRENRWDRVFQAGGATN